MEIIFLETGVDLEQQLAKLQLRRKRRWYMKISRGKWAIIGAVLMFSCLAGAVAVWWVLTNVVHVAV